MDEGRCTAGCGFFGNPACNGMCSKCFKESGGVVEQPKPAPVTAPQIEQTEQKPAVVEQEQKPIIESAEVKPSPPLQTTQTEAVVPQEEQKVEEKPQEEQKQTEEEAPKTQTNLNKCWFEGCGKRVGLVQTPCKCGFVYCPKHRHAESHNCTFDYFAQHQAKLTKENPMLAGNKMEQV